MPTRCEFSAEPKCYEREGTFDVKHYKRECEQTLEVARDPDRHAFFRRRAWVNSAFSTKPAGKGANGAVGEGYNAKSNCERQDTRDVE